MANLEKIEELKTSIAEWEAKKAGGSGFSTEVIDEIISKLKADLATNEAA